MKSDWKSLKHHYSCVVCGRAYQAHLFASVWLGSMPRYVCRDECFPIYMAQKQLQRLQR